MATTKPDLTRVWASAAPGANVVDPDTTTPGKVAAGWQAEVPPFEHFNFLQQWFTQGLAHFNEQGIGLWDTDTTYPIHALVKGSDGFLYKANLEQNGNDPVADDGTNWRFIYEFENQGSISTKVFGAVEDGVVNDDTVAIQAALDYAYANNIPIVKSFGRPRITAPINVPNGITWDLQNPNNFGSVYRSGSGWEQVASGELVVDFGSGTTTLASSAVQLNYGSGFRNASVWYPGQDPTAASPTPFPPSVYVVANSASPVMDQINFVNSYIGIDNSELHSNTRITNITGFPLFQGIIIGATNGFNLISGIRFVSSYAYRTTPPQEVWMVNNAVCITLRYCTWTGFSHIYCFAYSKLIFSETGPYAFPLPGASQRNQFFSVNCDNTPYGYHFTEDTAGSDFTNCNVNAGNDKDPTIVDGWAFKYEPNNPTNSGLRDISLSQFRVINSAKDAIIINEAEGFCMTDCKILNFATAVAGDAIQVNDSKWGSIKGCLLNGDGSVANSNGVVINGACEGVTITDNNFWDFNATGHKQLWIQAGALHYTITGNHFNNATAGLLGITDDAKHNLAVIHSNQDDKEVFSVDNTYVTANILQLPVDAQMIDFTDNSALSGLDDARHERRVTIIFSNATPGLLTSGANFVLKGGSRTPVQFETITFVCRLSTWWEI